MHQSCRYLENIYDGLDSCMIYLVNTTWIYYLWTAWIYTHIQKHHLDFQSVYIYIYTHIYIYVSYTFLHTFHLYFPSHFCFLRVFFKSPPPKTTGGRCCCFLHHPSRPTCGRHRGFMAYRSWAQTNKQTTKKMARQFSLGDLPSLKLT